MVRAFLALVMSFLAGNIIASPAWAQAWPTKPVKIIVSQAGGSTPDVLARLLSERLGPALGQPLVIDNRPGSGNIVGSEIAARSAPDGYTFFFATAAALATNPYTYKTLPYDPIKDFQPVAMIAKNPFFVLANPGVKATNLTELFALEKAQPGTLAIATEGPRNFTGILASWLNKLAGAKITEVSYVTIGQGVQDVIAGRVQLISLPTATAVPLITSGQLKALAVSSAAPMPRHETVPPVARTFPGFELIGWIAMVAPTGTPRPMVDRLNQELDKILKEPNERIANLGFFTDGAGTPETTGQYIRSQYETWGKVARDIGLQAE